jgi:prefoldin subunit 5
MRVSLWPERKKLKTMNCRCGCCKDCRTDERLSKLEERVASFDNGYVASRIHREVTDRLEAMNADLRRQNQELVNRIKELDSIVRFERDERAKEQEETLELRRRIKELEKTPDSRIKNLQERIQQLTAECVTANDALAVADQRCQNYEAKLETVYQAVRMACSSFWQRDARRKGSEP